MDVMECGYCKNEVPEVDMRKDIHGSNICEVCMEEAREISTTIKIFEKSGIYEFQWSPILGFRERASFNLLDMVPGLALHDEQLIPAVGFTSIVNNWIVAIGDVRLQKFMVMMKSLTSRQIIPPIPIIIAMTQYDGLSMGITVIVRETDSDVFKDWMMKSNQLQLH